MTGRDSRGWAKLDIEDLVRDKEITVELGLRGHDLVDTLFDADTVYASISPIDDGDLSFYWVAGRSSISIDLDADGGIWWSARENESSATGNETSLKELRVHLGAFSAHVESVNPDWPKLYWRNR